jgi:hypothetical protein
MVPFRGHLYDHTGLLPLPLALLQYWLAWLPLTTENIVSSNPIPNNLSLVCLYLSLYISFLLFRHKWKKNVQIIKKEIYILNDKYKHTRDRLFGLFQSMLYVIYCYKSGWCVWLKHRHLCRVKNMLAGQWLISTRLDNGQWQPPNPASIFLTLHKCLWLKQHLYLCTTVTSSLPLNWFSHWKQDLKTGKLAMTSSQSVAHNKLVVNFC